MHRNFQLQQAHNQNGKQEIMIQPLPRLQGESPSDQAAQSESPRSLSHRRRVGSSKDRGQVIILKPSQGHWYEVCTQLRQ